jgi:hypothetical protein
LRNHPIRAALAARDAWSRRTTVTAVLSPAQVRELLAVAAQHHVQVIPLIQTLGHVESILKQQRYAGLREHADDISQFCPCEPGSLVLVTALIDELLAAHPAARYIHLGGDETWLLGHCPRCAAKVQDQGFLAVYLDHMAALCRHVLAAGKIPLIWGDVVIGRHVIQGFADNWLRDGSPALQSLPPEVRLVYWDYHGQQPADFTHFDDYRRHGFTVWVAPTTRAGDNVPNYAKHLPNIGSFLEAGIAHGAEGALITSWCWKNMPFALTWHGLSCRFNAAQAWLGIIARRVPIGRWASGGTARVPCSSVSQDTLSSGWLRTAPMPRSCLWGRRSFRISISS